jgi:hypothetical protein
MSIWTTFRNPFGANRVPLLWGLSSADGKTPVPVSVDPNTGEILVNVAGNSAATLATGQQTVNTTAVQVSSTNKSLSNGVVIKSPSTNGANIYVGLTGVTTGTGDILEPGEARGYAVSNTNLLYIISISSTTDIVSFSAS